MPDEKVLALIQEARRRITDPVADLDIITHATMTLTSAQAQVLLKQTCYELDPGPTPDVVMKVQQAIQAGTSLPYPPVVMARIGTQRRCVARRDVLEALAGLQDGACRCALVEYRCDRWSQVKSLYWSCILESLAP